ncbi:uncharacterized protein EV420DRAFT_82001 [Desarmillaria tabescens]|uniref:Uncharacterized protein n=1 Tax=Armillaria tabescens TaxID=1929756 RepID=A0AA39NR26_ARMTA|nr:uncharacterized protein EV420DRAFT_82001 [Desarmillaria tabescens]KAK0469958.1 hypothetical protein EV420DRAFT_82001 [Desarmillaria tabescens]
MYSTSFSKYQLPLAALALAAAVGGWLWGLRIRKGHLTALTQTCLLLFPQVPLGRGTGSGLANQLLHSEGLVCLSVCCINESIVDSIYSSLPHVETTLKSGPCVTSRG